MNYVRSRCCSIPVPGNGRKGLRIMNKFRVIIYRLRWTFVERSHWIMAAVALAAFITSLSASNTEENSTGSAGLLAPIIALCAAAVVFAQATNPGGMRIRRTPGIVIGVSSLFSAYLWIADEIGIHPRDPSLPVLLLLLFAIPAAGILATALFLPASKPPSANHLPVKFPAARESKIPTDPGTGSVCE